MFAEYFKAAEKHVRAIGRTPSIDRGRPVSEAELDEIEDIIRRAIPPELRSFFREMGDGYSFTPDEDHDGFRIGLLSDYRYKVAGFAEVLRGEAPPGANHAHSAEIVAQELARRERWFPFYNFGGGGYLFCLDLNSSPAPVRYYERCYWPTDPIDHWELRMADSLLDFVRQWSRFCFADTNEGTLINLALDARGRFDWAPSLFEPIYDRGTTNA
jgi:hypothetical protein